MAKVKVFEVDDVLAMLAQWVEQSSQAEVGRQVGVSRQHVSDVMRGFRPPSGRLLDLLGMERVVMYRPLTSKSNQSLMREPA